MRVEGLPGDVQLQWGRERVDEDHGDQGAEREAAEGGDGDHRAARRVSPHRDTARKTF